MTDTRIRESLAAVRDAVDVPPVDRTALQARIRRARARRRAGRTGLALGAAATAAAVTVGALAVTSTGGAGGDGTSVAADPGIEQLPIVLDGHVQLLQPDGSLRDTGQSGRPIGWYDGRLVVLDGSRLLGVGDAGIAGVAAAFSDPTGVTYQRTDGQVVRIDADGSHELPGTGTLLGAGESAYVLSAADGVVVHGPAGPRPAGRGSDASTTSVDSAQVAGTTVVVLANGSEQFLDSDGTLRFGRLGGETGALSPDGATWAYAADSRERARGMRRGVFFASTDSDRERSAPLAQDAVQLAWSGGDVYVVTEAAGRRTLWQCRPGSCVSLYATDDPTLALR